MDSDKKAVVTCLYELLMKNDPNSISIIKSWSNSTISSENFKLNANKFKLYIQQWLEEKSINTESFQMILDEYNIENTFHCIIELVQSQKNDEINNLMTIFKKIKYCKGDELNGQIETFLSDLPTYIDTFKLLITKYTSEPNIRIQLLRTLKDMANYLFEIMIFIIDYCLEKSIEVPETLTTSIEQLLDNSFVLSEYPSRIIRKATTSQSGLKFSASINCLIDSDKLHVQNVNITVKLISSKRPSSADNKIDYTLNQNKSKLWKLSKMIWFPKEKANHNRHKSDRITDVQSTIKFEISAKLLYREITQPINKTLCSDLCIVIVHSNQETDALLSLFWYDNFPIDSPVEHIDLIGAINNLFLKDTGRSLTLANEQFLLDRLRFLCRNCSNKIDMVKFSREIMTDSDISFGHWIMQTIKLIKCKGVKELWNANYIVGFTSKEDKTLMEQQIGTFLLRFSERKPKIGVLYKANVNQLKAWNPYTLDECRSRNLSEYLMEFVELKSLLTADATCVKKQGQLKQFIEMANLDGYTQRGDCDFQLNLDYDFFDDIDADANVSIEEIEITSEMEF